MMMGLVFSVACFSFFVSFYCMPSWIHWLYTAAILVTQLTTPYIRIVPAPGDNQLTGPLFSPQLGSSALDLNSWVGALMIPSTGGGGQQVECCMCAFFCLSSYNLHKVIMIKSKTWRRCLLPSSPQNYWTLKARLRCDCHLMCQCWEIFDRS